MPDWTLPPLPPLPTPGEQLGLPPIPFPLNPMRQNPYPKTTVASLPPDAYLQQRLASPQLASALLTDLLGKATRGLLRPSIAHAPTLSEMMPAELAKIAAYNQRQKFKLQGVMPDGSP